MFLLEIKERIRHSRTSLKQIHLIQSERSPACLKNPLSRSSEIFTLPSGKIFWIASTEFPFWVKFYFIKFRRQLFQPWLREDHVRSSFCITKLHQNSYLKNTASSRTTYKWSKNRILRRPTATSAISFITHGHRRVLLGRAKDRRGRRASVWRIAVVSRDFENRRARTAPEYRYKNCARSCRRREIRVGGLLWRLITWFIISVRGLTLDSARRRRSGLIGRIAEDRRVRREAQHFSLDLGTCAKRSKSLRSWSDQLRRDVKGYCLFGIVGYGVVAP